MRRRWLSLGLALALIAGGLVLLATLAQPARVTVAWETGSESGTAAFNVWGSTAAVTNPVPSRLVNAAPIPARGNALTGAHYEIVDAEVIAGATYVYQIEEIDTAGAAHRQPDTITVRAGWPRAWIAAEALLLLGLGGVLLVTQLRRSPVD